mgnify:CR=1 FL=1
MDLKNKKIMAVGLAKSGISAAKLCLQSGAHVTVYDGKKEEALVDQLEQLKGGDYAFEKVTSRLHPGAVILLHSVSPDNAAALGRIIDYARANGYEFRALTDFPLQ